MRDHSRLRDFATLKNGFTSIPFRHKNGDITTHYSAAEIGELIAATNRISAAKGTPSITVLRVANGGNVGEKSRRGRGESTKPVAQTG